MTVTEAPRAVAPATADPTPAARPSGVAAVVGSGNPRTIGQLFIGTSLIFLLVSGVVGVLVGLERIDTSSADVFGDDLGRAYTLHTITGLFLVVLPLLLGLATAIVPLQVGAATTAFPRVSAAAYWTYLISGALMVASFAFDGGPFGSDAEGVDLFVVSLAAVLVAHTVAAISVVTTVITLRAPGLTLRRTPLFAWSSLVAGVVWVLTLPVLAAMLVLAYVDLRHGGQLVGRSDRLYDHIAWVFWQPTVYAFAVPALGIVGDIVPTFGRRRLFKHNAALLLIGLFGALAFGAWAQLGVTNDGGVDTPWLFGGPWVTTGVVAALPVLGLVGLLATTLRKGAPRLGAPLLLGLAGAVLVLAGVAAGVATVIKPLDLDGTTWMTGQANLVLLGAIAAGFAGVAFWSPKLAGKLLPEPLLGLSALLLLGGTLIYAVPDLVTGVMGQLRLVAGGAEGVDDIDTVEALNLVSLIGGVIVVLGILAFLLAMAKPRGAGQVADDPWEGHTLEWATASPPAVGNFGTLPEIASEAPVYDARHASSTASTEAAP
ncbi:MAG TPA: cbb3-type cytochrome c oxidase subunit I [Acidimicrobiales bacterium]|nr:cbb3-type cytochrome c oxidase subunit I [Acidimicrobiales bacterium]